VAIDGEELEGLAAEYVIGTLDADERRAAEARIAADAAFAAAVASWAARLQPIADSEVPVAPAANTFERILARIGSSSSPVISVDNIVVLRRQVRRWRIGAMLTGAVAAALLAVVVLDQTRAPPTEFVAMLTPDGGTPAFVLTVDTAKNTLSIRRVADAAPADKSYQLWAVEPGAQPKSLGVVERASFTRDLPYKPQDLVFAVSLEPTGGSPTGAPTGPVVFSGPLLQSN
jgi:anti-sigma-K factor RskA